MMEEDSVQQQKCPDIAVLSAFYDGETDLDSMLSRHLETCCHCRNQLRQMGEIDRMLKQRVATGMRYYNAERIKAQVHHQLTAQRKLRIWKWTNRALPLAASFMLGMAVWQVFQLSPSTNTANPQVDSVTTDQTAAETAALEQLALDWPYYVNMPGNNALTDSALYGPALPYAEMLPINTQPGSPVSTTTASMAPELENSWALSQAARNPVAIADQVQQVWVINNVESMESFLKTELEKVNVKPENVSIRRTDKGISLELNLTKRELVLLVRNCHAAGAELLTPVQPQPEQESFRGNASDKVAYQAHFVTNN